ncbi:uncharacterized protein LOC135500638 [Lineus longissimus]|uniref:uncharacterized protein LOC135495983 n=1 Tax=Lineus longissimus TaxID=88925 RepID=UPI00315D6A01
MQVYGFIFLFLLSASFVVAVFAPPPEDRLTYSNFLHTCMNTVLDVQRCIAQEDEDDSDVDLAVERLEAVQRNILRVAYEWDECQPLSNLIQSMITALRNEHQHQAQSQRQGQGQPGGGGGGATAATASSGTDTPSLLRRQMSGFHPPRVRNGRMGPPVYDISQSQLEHLFDLDFTVPRIAAMLHVSVATVRRRLRFFNLSYKDRRTLISDAELDGRVQSICSSNRRLGYRLVRARLVVDRIFVSRQRVRDSLLRTDPTSVALRWSQTIRRRTYHVAGPNSLWHIDGNHKLIRWGFVIHGGIDGYSRLMVFLSVVCNNRAESVMTAFQGATAEYGVPSRVRADRGTENNDVEHFMNIFRGRNRGSMIRGRSVHNQRIERFWRDLLHGCTHVYYDLFHFMEDAGILDVSDTNHRWALQFVYNPRIRRSVEEYRQQWNHHQLSTERGSTPIQLYVEGLFNLYGTSRPHVDDIFFANDNIQLNNIESFGIDWEGPTPNSTGTTTVNVVEPDGPLSVERLTVLQQTISPLGETVDGHGMDIYLNVLNFISQS